LKVYRRRDFFEKSFFAKVGKNVTKSLLELNLKEKFLQEKVLTRKMMEISEGKKGFFDKNFWRKFVRKGSDEKILTKNSDEKFWQKILTKNSDEKLKNSDEIKKRKKFSNGNEEKNFFDKNGKKFWLKWEKIFDENERKNSDKKKQNENYLKNKFWNRISFIKRIKVSM